MNRKVFNVSLTLLLVSLPLFKLAGPVFAADAISINAGQIVKTLNGRGVGINANYLMDDDHGRTIRARSTLDALKEIQPKFMRYPGGEKSDAYLWSVPPFDRSIPTLSRTGTCEWPSGDSSLVQSDLKTFKIDPLDFDEFMTTARAVGAEPILVVDYDSMYKPSPCGGTSPTRQQLIDTAVAWVNYANKVKGYNVKYWEIGNETYLDSYNGTASIQNYVADLKIFSTAMKQVDPTIKIGANGNSLSWWQSVVTGAGSYIDFLSAHEYPAWQWNSYNYYLVNIPDLYPETKNAINAINNYASAADKSRLRVLVTETDAMDWSTGGWANINDAGHALVLFEMLNDLMKDPLIDSAMMWNTRWVKNSTDFPYQVYDAIDKYGNLNPSGRILNMWNANIQTNIVSTTSTNLVRSFASISDAKDSLVVFLINKDVSAHTANISLSNFTFTGNATKTVFKGTSPTDLQPSWSTGTAATFQNNSASIILDPLSVTILKLAKTSTCSTDINLDGITDLSDYSILANNYFKTTLTNPRADINLDGIVDITDYSLLAAKFLQVCTV
jgi:alpha-L-arabinofuranosidase